MAEGFWVEHFGAKEAVTNEELLAALAKLTRGKVADEALSTLVKYSFFAGNGEVQRGKFMHFAAVFAPFEGLVAKALGSLFEYKPKLASYVVRKWYHGGMDRATGTGLVRSGGEGCFLVRDSSLAGNLALQFVSHGTVKTTLLYNIGEPGFALSKSPGADAVYSTVNAFVEFALESGKFTTSPASNLHKLSLEEAEAAAKERAASAAPAGGNNYAAFDMDGEGDYGPLPDLPGTGGSNYAAFDLDAGGPAPVAAAAPPTDGEYGAFDLDDMGAALADTGAAAGGGNSGGGAYGAFDPDELGGGGAPAADAATPTGGASSGGMYGAFDPDADDTGYGALPSLDNGGTSSSNYASFDPDA